MKKPLFTLLCCVALLYVSPSSADSWRIYRKSASYLNGDFTGNIKLPAEIQIDNVMLLSDGMILCTGADRNFFVINRDGSITENPQFPSGISLNAVEGSARNSSGKAYLYSSSSICYFDTEIKKWQGIGCRSGESVGDLPPLKCAAIYDMTFDTDDNMVVTGISDESKPFVATLKEGAWQIFDIDEQVATDNEPAKPNGGGFRDSYKLGSLVPCKDGSVWMMQQFNGQPRALKFMNGTVAPVASTIEFTSIQTDHNGNILYTTAENTGLLDPVSGKSRVLVDGKTNVLAADASALWYAVNIRNQPFATQPGYTTLLRRMDMLSGETIDYTTVNCPIDSPIDIIDADAAGNLAVLSGGQVLILDKTDMSKYDGNWSLISSGYMKAEEYAKADWLAENNSGTYPVSVSWLQADPMLRYVGLFRNGAWEYRKMAVDTEAPLLMGVRATWPISVCNTSQGIIVGTANDGPMLFDAEREHASNLPGYNNKEFGDNIRAIAEAADGILWFATNKGLLRYENGTFTLFNKKNSAFASNGANCLYVAPDNTLWVGTAGEGVFTFDGTTWNNHAKKEVFKSGNIGSIVASGQTIFVSEYGALMPTKTMYVYENGAFRSEELPFSPRRNELLIDGNGNSWSISESGVVCRKPDGEYVVYDRSNSPVGKTEEESPTAYSITGFYNDGKIYLKTSYQQMHDYDGDSEALEALHEKYKDRVNTFSEDAVYVLDVD